MADIKFTKEEKKIWENIVELMKTLKTQLPQINSQPFTLNMEMFEKVDKLIQLNLEDDGKTIVRRNN